jgi:hypothetical protein
MSIVKKNGKNVNQKANQIVRFILIAFVVYHIIKAIWMLAN